MSDVTTVEGITVVGQRRVASGLGFPIRPSGGGGGGGGTSGGEEENTLPDDPNWGQPELLVQDPCANPASALAWNADAAAAAAVAEMLVAARDLNDGSNFSNREFGTTLYRTSGGDMANTGITWGERAVVGQVPNVILSTTGVDSSNYMGDIHNHPSGDGRLSDGEWTNFINLTSAIAQLHPERRPDLDAVAAYVVVADPTASAGYRIYAHTRRTPYGELGEEVNPDAQPCQG